MGILENKSRARLFYKYLSQVYDKINPFIWNEEMRTEAIGMLDIQADDRILDVGCGTGFATEGLLGHENVDEVWGLDQSPHQLEKAFAKFGRTGLVNFHMGDAERLPFATNSFDIIWSSGSIEYWPNPVRALREFRRVVKPGGQILVVGPNYPKTTIMQKVADAIMLFYDEAEADRMFNEAGLEDVRHRLMGPSYDPDVAITTVARAPGEEDEVASGPAEEPEHDMAGDRGAGSDNIEPDEEPEHDMAGDRGAGSDNIDPDEEPEPDMAGDRDAGSDNVEPDEATD